jgi:hypothetical protein
MLFSKNQRIGSDVNTTTILRGAKRKKKMEVMIV